MSIEAMKQALEALEHSHANEPMWKTPHREAITSLRQAIAEAEEIFEAGRQQGIKQEHAMWMMSRAGQEIEAEKREAYREPVAHYGACYVFCPRCGAVGKIGEICRDSYRDEENT